MEARRLRAPSQDGGLLAVPPLSDAGASLQSNLDLLGRWDHDFQGRRAGRLRAMARNQAWTKARGYLAQFGVDSAIPGEPNGPLILTGHQPELFHPGVWIKNFAIAAVARKTGGRGLNLIVDDDVPKGASIRVPMQTDAGLRTALVDFDEWNGECPFEDWSVQDETRFSAFDSKLRAKLSGQVRDPILDEYWPLVRDASQHTDRIGLRCAVGRRRLEQSWGIANAEIPLSTLCDTEAFHWFAAHLIAQLPRYREIHNAALVRYRALYGIRSRHHPVPALGREDQWLEAPFWVWRSDRPRRRPLLVRQLAKTVELRMAGEERPFLELPLSPDREACCAVDALATLPSRQIRLRTRALTTTMYARLLVGDLFLHGIGGAKYDELGDEIIRQFFGIDPPEFLTLSMTLWLGLADTDASLDRLHEVERRIRDLQFNPERYLPDSERTALQAWIGRKRAAIAAPVATRRQRVARYYEILQCNRAMQAGVEADRQELVQLRSKLLSGIRINRIVRGRDYAFVLHSKSRLRAAFESALA
jgi:hypothetical protein